MIERWLATDEAHLLRKDAPYPFGRVLEMLKEIVGQEPAFLTVVPRRVAIPRHEDVSTREHGNVSDQLVQPAFHRVPFQGSGP